MNETEICLLVANFKILHNMIYLDPTYLNFIMHICINL